MTPAGAARPAPQASSAIRESELGQQAEFRQAVLNGLSGRPRTLPCKYFYDAAGSALFERICHLPEYYVTRVELAIMRARITEMAAALGRGVLLIELGSGNSFKTRLLLAHLDNLAAYVPVDIDSDMLERTAADLAERYPKTRILPLQADFSSEFSLPEGLPETGRRVIYFPGSTLGNFEPKAAESLLARMARLAGPGGALLIGIDLRKDPAILEAAYNDRDGVTAEFNLNLLRRIRDELGGELDLGGFRHFALYNRSLGRIEMHLRSVKAQVIRLDGRVFHFDEGETIHTENSYKFDPDEFAALAGRSGFRRETEWTDERRRFAVQLYRVE